MSVIMLTTGVPGSGKTYIRCARFVANQFLPHSRGVHYSNFPIYRDKVADFVHRRYFSRLGLSRFFYRYRPTVDDLFERVQVIPPAVIDLWRRGDSGPWEYFKDIDLQGAHIAIDEIHEIISSSSSGSHVEKWDAFLGTIRHLGCTIEGLTQDVKSIHSCFTSRASIQNELVPLEDLRDPFFGIRVYDWYQLKAGFTGDFHKSVCLVEKKKNAFGRFVKNNSTIFHLTSDYFDLYNSYSKPSI